MEIQNGYDLDKSRKLIDYAKALNEKYGKKIIVLSLAFKGFPNPKKNKGFEISLAKTNLSDYKIIKKFDDYVIYQIDLDYCRTLIQKKKSKLWILNEKQVMNLSSKEWIKYLTLPIWCKSSDEKKYYYEFPPINKDFFKSENVYDAFKILTKQDKANYLKSAFDQESQANVIHYCRSLYNKIDEVIKEKDEVIKGKDEVIKDKDEEIKNLKDEIKRLKIRNSNSKSNDKKNKTNNKKSKKPGKIRKTSIMYISSEDDN